MPGNILEATKFRYNVYPVQHKATFDLYKQAVACFWTVEELDFAKDKSDFEKLAPQQQEFILRVLSFFAVSDALVMRNCMSFQSQVQWPEAELFFAQQGMMEAIHQETYGLMLETLSLSPERQEQLVTAWRTDGAVKAKLEWMQRWMVHAPGDGDDGLEDGERFLRRVAAWLACEGILFSVSFASIFYLKKQGVGMQGLLTANEFISRDEGLHAGFGVHLLRESGIPTLGEAVVHDIFRGAVKVEKMFARESLRLPLLGMNADLMCQYVDFVADYWLQACGYKMLGDKAAVNPFDWMNLISLQGKTNFFEKRVSEYAKAGVGVAPEEQVFKMDADF